VTAVIRLALLDDHPAVLTGLQRLLEHARDIEVLAAAPDEVALANALRGQRADILIVDYDPRRGDALSLCRRIKSRPAAPKVLFYTAYASPALAIAARVAEADGVVDKSGPPAVLLSAIRRIADGEKVFPRVRRDDFEAAVSRLDDTDLPIFAMLLDGAPVPEIADGLRSDEREAARRAQHVVRRLRPRHAEDYGSISPRRIA
jgi:DNA-binding NarL/FixJ family response regulator